MPARGQRRRQQEELVFPFFRELPAELRCMVWEHSWEPRTVTLYPIEPTDKPVFLRPRGGNLLPASGYVNTESREHTLRRYKRCFSHGDSTDFRWFNFHLDTLCLATFGYYLVKLDHAELRQVQRLIVPEWFPGCVRAATPCPDTWPEPVSESFDSPEMEELLEKHYPSLREITLTTGKWAIQWCLERIAKKPEDCWKFEPRRSPYVGWGHMRTTYVGKLKVRHSPSGGKTYQQRYCCRMSDKDVDLFLYRLRSMLWWDIIL
ncbi:hypothetical protein F5Y10DRAFT_79040 [Nemania abortiva]|nr:hypothetical protein F5Y10DRAFT_79040 [Nemania abortiva]